MLNTAFLALFTSLLTSKGSQQWDVKFPHHQICALVGSSVVIPCTITQRPNDKIKKVYWQVKKNHQDIKDLLNYKDRVQYFWEGSENNNNMNCSLKLSMLKMTDNGAYYVGMVTGDKKVTSQSKFTLSVKELDLRIPELVMEGNKVILNCSNICSSKDTPTVIWKKNGENLQTSKNELILQNVSAKQDGNYSCAVKPYENQPSKSVKLNVMFPPRTPSISVSPAGETLEGATVTLTCRSDANPTVESYTWSKGKGSTMSNSKTGDHYRIANVSSEHSGYYYCEAKSKYGASNATLYLNVYYAPRNISASLNQSGDQLEGGSVTLSCSSDANPPVENYTWYRRTGAETEHVGSGEIITFKVTSVNAGFYHCEARNSVDSRNSTAVEVIWSGSGWWTAPLMSSLGFLVILILLIGLVFWRRRRTNPSNDSRRSDHITQGASSNVYGNFSALPLTSDPAQNAASGNPDDVQYFSVQFKTTRGQQQQQQHQQGELEYSAVNFSRPTAAT